MIKSIFLSISALLFFQISQAQTQLKLPALVSDNMVLQQTTEISIWGWAEDNNTVKILPSWTQVPVSVKVNNSGKWKASLNTPVAGGPYTIALSSGNESIVLKNVMIGEVWLASGQSNMEMPIKGYRSEPINGNNELILNSKNSNIRMFTVARNSSKYPQGDCDGSWKISSPENTLDFSAVGYVFAQKLNRALNVPIGIIHSSWGGTPVEAWIQKSALNSSVSEQEQSTFNYNRSSTKREQDAPSQLFNGMIHPVLD
ncbi:MAG: sialate O-acetylesterase, partial [Flavobacteriaceae bacterium]